MVYFGPDRVLVSVASLVTGQIFSCTFPHTKWETWEEVSKRDWDCYRPIFMLLTQADLDLMKIAAEKMLGTHYDVGQLLDIALNKILGYGVGSWHTFFDFGAKMKVCSVAARTIFEALRHWTRTELPSTSVKKIYDELFPKLFGGVNVERTAPAHFANSPQEFQLVASCGR